MSLFDNLPGRPVSGNMTAYHPSVYDTTTTPAYIPPGVHDTTTTTRSATTKYVDAQIASVKRDLQADFQILKVRVDKGFTDFQSLKTSLAEYEKPKAAVKERKMVDAKYAESQEYKDAGFGLKDGTKDKFNPAGGTLADVVKGSMSSKGWESAVTNPRLRLSDHLGADWAYLGTGTVKTAKPSDLFGVTTSDTKTNGTSLAFGSTPSKGEKVVFITREPSEETIRAWKIPKTTRGLADDEVSGHVRSLAAYLSDRGVEYTFSKAAVVVGNETFEEGDWVVENFDYETDLYVYAKPTLEERKKFDLK